MRVEFAIPAGSFVDLDWDLTRFAASANVDAARTIGPCEAQVGLVGYLENDESRRMDATTAWMPNPCPGYHAQDHTP
jgi:hypothetical protein